MGVEFVLCSFFTFINIEVFPNILLNDFEFIFFFFVYPTTPSVFSLTRLRQVINSVPVSYYSCIVLFLFHNRLEISINMVYLKKIGKDIPMLSILDDGHGMTHEDTLRMVSFGHKHPVTDDTNRIGRFGIGFKVFI